MAGVSSEKHMNEENFEILWSRLVAVFHKEPKKLTHEEFIFYSVNSLRGSVPRSGFIGFFENNNVSVITAAHKGLAEMNLTNIAALLNRAQQIAIGNKRLPSDGSYIEVVPRDSEEEYEKESERLEHALYDVESAFYKYDDVLWDALGEYARKHQLES